jgi:hypothetical protein
MHSLLPRIIVVAIVAALSAAAAEGAPIAMWVWEKESFRLLDDLEYRRNTIDVLSRRGFTTLYVYADAYRNRTPIVYEAQLYRSLIRDLHAAGFSVYALLGSADLLTERYLLPEKRYDGMAMVRRVIDYNMGTYLSAERFDGINIDVEPYLMPRWAIDPYGVMLLYLEFSNDVMTLKRQTGATLLIGPSMPFWYDGTVINWRGADRRMNEHVQLLYDYVTIMDYRDRADGNDGIIAHAVNEMLFGEAIGKPVVVGVDTGPGELPKTTFSEENDATMRAELAKTEDVFAPFPSFGGFAVHHLQRYLEWCCPLRRRGM